MRYIWDMYHPYASAMSPMTRAVFRLVSHYMRGWDYAAAARVDHFVSNSRFVAGRIRKFYRRPSTVIHPPVDVQSAWINDKQLDYYLSVGRLVQYKRVDLAVQACSQLGRHLRVIGDGPEYRELKRLAGPTVTFLGHVSDEEVRQNYAECRALLFPSEEDFGIAPVEANAFGRPVIAYAAGGVLETVVGLDSSHSSQEAPIPTGVFFHEQTVSSLVSSILNFESRAGEFSPHEMRDHAMHFDTSVFLERFAKLTLRALTSTSAPKALDANESESTMEEEYA
jgi:glycosyltransferase involved in cell wall biosynthesis